MTFHWEQTVHMNAEWGTRDRPDVAGDLEVTRPPGLTHDEIDAVVARNNVGFVHHKMIEGTVGTSRVRYARDGSTLYIPAWTSIESWYAARLPALECHVSEIDWRSGWRYVRLRGQVTPLHPTGAPREREAWRKAVAALRGLISDMPPTDDLALANFGVVQLDIEFWEGAVVVWEEGSSALTAGTSS